MSLDYLNGIPPQIKFLTFAFPYIQPDLLILQFHIKKPIRISPASPVILPIEWIKTNDAWASQCDPAASLVLEVSLNRCQFSKICANNTLARIQHHPSCSICTSPPLLAQPIAWLRGNPCLSKGIPNEPPRLSRNVIRSSITANNWSENRDI